MFFGGKLSCFALPSYGYEKKTLKLLLICLEAGKGVLEIILSWVEQMTYLGEGLPGWAGVGRN